MGINTILGAVTWEDIEPVEGNFNFVELDAVIAGARRYGIRLGILWFGSYMNGKLPLFCQIHFTDRKSDIMESYSKV